MNNKTVKLRFGFFGAILNLVALMTVSYGQEQIPPPDFVEFDKAPSIIKRVNPVYPEIARKAGLEGSVWVKMWVDKEGKVKKAVIQKSASDIFDQAALDAAKQFAFQPASSKDRPVEVWVSIPFHFKLNGLKPAADTTRSSQLSQEEIQQMMVPMMRQMMESMMDGILTTLAKKESAEKLALFKKNLYDALLAQGFTKEQAIQITIATGIPAMPSTK
jgi:TonB family protein